MLGTNGELKSEVLQWTPTYGHTYAERLSRSYIHQLCTDIVKMVKERSRRYPAQTITDADDADDIALLANIPAQAETLLHDLERAAAGIGLYVNADKTEYMCFNQRGNISTLKGGPLKLVVKFTKEAVSHQPRKISTRY